MIKYFIATALTLAGSGLFAQNETRRYLGKHFGDHPNTEYFVEKKLSNKANTLTYEEIRYDRNQIRTATYFSFRHVVKLTVTDKVPVVVYDSAATASGEFVFSVTVKGDSLIDNTGKLFPKAGKGDPLTFTSFEGLETYLKYNPPTRNFQVDFNYLDEAPKFFRPFRMKTIGEIKIAVSDQYIADCYELAVYSLDSSNVADGKLYIDKSTSVVVKKEYIVHEKTDAAIGDVKSAANELMVSRNYEIDLSSIVTPSASDYVEAAFTKINRNGDYNGAQKIIDKALNNNVSFELILARLRMMTKQNTSAETIKFLKAYWDNSSLTVMDLHRIGRSLLRDGKIDLATEIFEHNVKKHPDNYVTLVGLARAYSVKGELKKAKDLLERAVKLDMDEGNRTNIKNNITHLSNGEKML
jgi:tetratricopeptide (TPR) repeat protein